MKFRTGAITGLCVGYYLGAKAGRERYEQMSQMLEKVQGSESFEMATNKAKAVIDLTKERAKDVAETYLHTNGKTEEVTAGTSA